MPWCRIDGSYPVGEVAIIPFDRDKPIDGLSGSDTDTIRTILGSYRSLEGQAIRYGALIMYEDRSLLADLTNEEIEVTHELVGLACFTGLAKREFFSAAGRYCNADCFIVYAQKFENLDFIAITSRRRDGRTWDARPIAETVITVPVHASAVDRRAQRTRILESVSVTEAH